MCILHHSKITFYTPVSRHIMKRYRGLESKSFNMYVSRDTTTAQKTARAGQPPSTRDAAVHGAHTATARCHWWLGEYDQTPTCWLQMGLSLAALRVDKTMSVSWAWQSCKVGAQKIVSAGAFFPRKTGNGHMLQRVLFKAFCVTLCLPVDLCQTDFILLIVHFKIFISLMVIRCCVCTWHDCLLWFCLRDRRNKKTN